MITLEHFLRNKLQENEEQQDYAVATDTVRAWMDEYAEQFKPKPTISPDVQQNLFNYFAEQHDIQLMVSDFHEIENYMKLEVQQTAMEFAEWCEINGWRFDHDMNKWSNNGSIYFKRHTTSELFAKFEAERNQNGG